MGTVLTAAASILMETWSSLKQERKGGRRCEVISFRECSYKCGGGGCVCVWVRDVVSEVCVW